MQGPHEHRRVIGPASGKRPVARRNELGVRQTPNPPLWRQLDPQLRVNLKLDQGSRHGKMPSIMLGSPWGRGSHALPALACRRHVLGVRETAESKPAGGRVHICRQMSSHLCSGLGDGCAQFMVLSTRDHTPRGGYAESASLGHAGVCTTCIAHVPESGC